jgi:uncharacterized protein YecT (DUF1311 family)
MSTFCQIASPCESQSFHYQIHLLSFYVMCLRLMTPRNGAVGLAFLFMTIAPSHAPHMNEKDSPCFRIVVTTDLVDCLSKARDSSDAKLNSLYQRIRKKLDAGDLDRLTETQRLWIKYRDANCSAERALYNGATASCPAHLGCLEALTRARTKELEITYAVKLKRLMNAPRLNQVASGTHGSFLIRSIVPLLLAVCHERLSFPWNHLGAVAVSQACTLGEDL